MTTVLFQVRDYRASDFAFILSSWRRSYEQSPAVRDMHAEDYKVAFTKIITKLIDKTTIRVVVASDDSDTIVAWASVSGDCLCYVYVRQSFRGMGLARMAMRSWYTKRYAMRSKRWDPKRAGLKFDPSVIFELYAGR